MVVVVMAMVVGVGVVLAVVMLVVEVVVVVVILVESSGSAWPSPARVHGGKGGALKGMRVPLILVTIFVMMVVGFLPVMLGHGSVQGGLKGRCRIGMSTRIGIDRTT